MTMDSSPTHPRTAHVNFVGGDETLPIIISVLTTPVNGELQAIYRTKTDTIVRGIPAVPNKKDKILKQIRESFAEELKDARLAEVKDPQIEKELVNMEDRMLVKHYSFGVLYCKSGQRTEDEIFSNREDGVSQAYLDFLGFIGDKVKLEGFPGPKVGLDTKSTFIEHANSWLDSEPICQRSSSLPFVANDRVSEGVLT